MKKILGALILFFVLFPFIHVSADINLFDAKLGIGQIFDVQRSTIAGGYRVSGMNNPFDSSVGNGSAAGGRQFSATDLNNRYFQFEIKDRASNLLSLYIYNSNGTPATSAQMTSSIPASQIGLDGFVSTGKIYCAGQEGLLFISTNGYGFFIANSIGYANGASLDLMCLPNPSIDDIEEYVYSDIPLLANEYAIVYNSNTTDTVSDIPNTAVKQKNVAINIAAEVPQRTGYTFVGWNTTKDGKGIWYNPGELYQDNNSLILFAIYNPFTVTYKKNTSDIVNNIPASQMKYESVDLYLSSLVPTRTNYVFVEWNTKADGTGIRFLPGSVYNLDEYLILYAIYSPYKIIYEPNSYYNVENMPASADKIHGTPFQISNKIPVIEGHIFREWNTEEYGGGITYLPGSIYNVNKDLILYALYDPIEFVVTLDLNTNDPVTFSEDLVHTRYYNDWFDFYWYRPVRDNFTFMGWNTKKDGSGDMFNEFDYIMVSNDITFYAIYSPYIVTYEKNLPENVNNIPASDYKSEGVNFTISNLIPSMEGYIFKEWNTAADGSGQLYHPGDEYTKDEYLTLYAIYQKILKININGQTFSLTEKLTLGDLNLASFKEKEGYTFQHFVIKDTDTIISEEQPLLSSMEIEPVFLANIVNPQTGDINIIAIIIGMLMAVTLLAVSIKYLNEINKKVI